VGLRQLRRQRKINEVVCFERDAVVDEYSTQVEIANTQRVGNRANRDPSKLRDLRLQISPASAGKEWVAPHKIPAVPAWKLASQ